MYSSPGSRSISLIGNDVAEFVPTDALEPFVDFESEESLPIGRPISAAELVLRPLLPVVVARLNICGNRPRDNDEEPSGGCICWKDSNSARRAFKVFRNSIGFEELRSMIVGSDKPNKR